MKTLGLLPGPILFGHVVDSYCTVWQDTCGVKGRCFDYDVDKLSNAVCVLGTSFTCKLLTCKMNNLFKEYKIHIVVFHFRLY